MLIVRTAIVAVPLLQFMSNIKLDSLSCSSTSISFPTECILTGSRLNHINTCILRCIRVLYHCLLLYT